jgi:hypothetical protein
MAISSDEERCINDILDKGINEIRGGSRERDRERERENLNLLKSSIINSDRTSTNLNNNSTSVRSGRENNNLNNIHINVNPNYLGQDTFDVSTSKSNTTVNGKSNIRSTALRQLLDEMKINNKYISSSEDDFESRLKSKNISETIQYKQDTTTHTLSPRTMRSPKNNNNQISKQIPVPIPNTSQTETLNSQSDLNFNDMKSEINHLQSKIGNLEKKLSI